MSLGPFSLAELASLTVLLGFLTAVVKFFTECGLPLLKKPFDRILASKYKQ
jgi:hypothetical protein